MIRTNLTIKCTTRKTITIILAVLVLWQNILLFHTEQAYSAPGQPLKEKFKLFTPPNVDEKTFEKYTYSRYLADHGYSDNFQSLNEFNQTIFPSQINYYDKSKAKILNQFGGKKGEILFWDREQKYIEWEVNVPYDGFYEIAIEYYPAAQKEDFMQRAFYIDGKIPFFEAANIAFYRYWTDATSKRVFNAVGDEIMPPQKEIKRWVTQYLRDVQGIYSSPLKFFLSKGKHLLKLEYIVGDMAISKISISAAQKIPNYKSYIAEIKNKSQNNRNVEIKIEGENIYSKNDLTIRKEYSGDPACTPYSKDNIRLNLVGGWRWRRGNQEVSWKVSVPRDGLYKIGVRYYQGYRLGLMSYRQILIDGKVPFAEFEAYPFKYNRNWQFNFLTDKTNKHPYYVYLTKGEHVITFRNVAGEYSYIIDTIDQISIKLSNVIKRIIAITGSNPDLNFDYELDKKIPNLINDLKEMANNLQKISIEITKISGERPSIVNQFMAFRDQLLNMINDPFIIPRQLNDLVNAQTTITTWLEDLGNQPLGIDYIILASPDKKTRAKVSTILERIMVSWYNFINSFRKDYNKVAGLKNYTGKKYKVLDVWVARGKEWAEVMKQMADEDFTPKTNIAVRINVLPAGQLSTGGVNALLLSIVSGNYPDVACGVDRQAPVELAIRDAAANLKLFNDFDKIKSRFIDGVMDSYKYRNGVFALPETMDFTVMFYRKDIIKELGINLPSTWDELYKTVLPVLAQHGMQFYYGNGLASNNVSDDFIPFLYQRGGSFYTPDGLKSALDTDKAFMAFKEWTDLYNVYKIPVSANFFNRFRTGEMPIGIAGYNMYMLLTVAAPELYGRWGIAPIPGHKRDDGTIDRTASANTSAIMILNGSRKKQEAWEFVKWWTSAETQAKFGKEIEAYMGVEARWNTANIEAFSELPWKPEDIAVIKEQWKWYRSQPVVLGGYFTNRHLLNAWTKVVVDAEELRDALEKAVKDINREMQTKQKEYGITR